MNEPIICEIDNPDFHIVARVSDKKKSTLTLTLVQVSTNLEIYTDKIDIDSARRRKSFIEACKKWDVEITETDVLAIKKKVDTCAMEREREKELPVEKKVWDEEILKQARSYSYETVKETLKQYLVFSHDSDYDAFLASIVQSYIPDMVEKVFYLGFTGAKSSGKTTSTIAWAFLGNKIIHVATTTSAAICLSLDKYIGISFDELDRLLKRSEGDVIEGLLQNGIQRGQPYIKAREIIVDGVKTYDIQHLPTFGPKAFNYFKKPGDHLTSRTIVIHMPRQNKAELRRKATMMLKEIPPIKAWLELEVEKAKKDWTNEKVYEYWNSDEFIEKSDKLKVSLPRTGEIGDELLLIGKIMNWDLEKHIQNILVRLDDNTADDFILEEVKDAILTIVNGEVPAKDVYEISSREVKIQIDTKRKVEGGYPIDYRIMVGCFDELELKRVKKVRGEDIRGIQLTKNDVTRLKNGTDNTSKGAHGAAKTSTLDMKFGKNQTDE